MDEKFIKKVRRKDRMASRLITVGGILVIASVIAILVLIVKVALPLFLPSTISEVDNYRLPRDSSPFAIGVDDYREVVYTLDQNGIFTFQRLIDDQTSSMSINDTSAGKTVQSVDTYKNSILNVLWNDNSLTMVEVQFSPVFDQQGKRTIKPSIKLLADLPAPDVDNIKQTLARLTEDNRLTRVDLLVNNSIHITNQVTTTDLFDNTREETFTYTIAEKLPGDLTVITMDEQANSIYGGTVNGYLLRWDISDNESAEKTDMVLAVAGKTSITTLNLVFGDQSISVGDANGDISTWMLVRQKTDNNIRKLTQIHPLSTHDASINVIISSRRSKMLYSLSSNGGLHADHMTSENHVFDITKPLTLFNISSRDNTLVGLDRENIIHVWAMKNPHPEINLKTLFAKVFYEGYDKPEFVWQSSAQTDDSEPKLSITPLIFGTIKGTFYAMIFSIPLAIFGAVYTSQFTTYAFRKTIKPVIEILASIPSVVIGFLIALWLAPIIEDSLFAVLLSFPLLPIVFVFFIITAQPLYGKETIKNRIKGFEFLVLIPVIFLTAVLATTLAPILEPILFQGDLKLWLFNEAGMRYDQRNCIIIAFGLGVCVIPIIFSITEDAISNIPPSLSAASLALGASRWQTVWRVILPSASPGIFAAIIIGFGRAVGETMIVLMATGNTPILDWSIFNGMRTLSANIAVEIPEAPVNGTLYRTLFLCATILFLLTFVLNTGAEIVRERLRKKYGRY